MKKIFYILPAFLLSIIQITIAHAQVNRQSHNLHNGSKVLVVYFSHTGNTKKIAEYIISATDADSFEITTVEPYTTDHKALVKQSEIELRQGFRPALKGKLTNTDDYDTIFIGSPSWFATFAPPVFTFLSENDLSGKTLIPFVTHEGSGMGNIARDIAKSAPEANVISGRAFRGKQVNQAQDEVNQWVKNLKL